MEEKKINTNIIDNYLNSSPSYQLYKNAQMFAMIETMVKQLNENTLEIMKLKELLAEKYKKG